MNDSYITLSGRSCEEILINKSRFIGYAATCGSEKEALDFLEEIRSSHRGATHHCYAYVIGPNSGIMRYSDDGEPGGTAGLPILEVIRAKQIVNCCVVVVRYFGGVLLGTGGLVRAYTRSCQAAIDAAGLSRMELTADFSCELPYALWDRFRHHAESLPVRIMDVTYGSSVSFHLLIRTQDSDRVRTVLTDACGGKLVSVPVTESFMAWSI